MNKQTQSKQEQGEPVGYINHGIEYHTKGKTIFHAKPSTNLEKRWWTDDIPVYTTPQQRKPLTADQKHDLVTNFFSDSWAIEKAMELLDDYEAAHGIKE